MIRTIIVILYSLFLGAGMASLAAITMVQKFEWTDSSATVLLLITTVLGTAFFIWWFHRKE
jgi:hypothetical protein